jgi:hypothetical protein
MKVGENGLEDDVPASHHVPPVASALFEAMKQHIALHYRAASEAEYVTALKLTTKDIFDRMQKLFPSPSYSAADLAEWLYEKQFNFYDDGGMKFVWLLIKI